MMRTYRLAGVERLIEELKNVDYDSLYRRIAFKEFWTALIAYVQAEGKPGNAYTWVDLLQAIAKMIEEAIEGGDE